MVLSIKEKYRITNSMVMVQKNGKTIVNTQVSTSKVRKKEKVNFYGKTNHLTKDNSRKMQLKEKVNLHGQMVVVTKEDGWVT